MSHHQASIDWQRDATRTSPEQYRAQRYSRSHRLHFDGGAEIAASASPSNVALPWSDSAAVDPEELYVAALASCHMLWFLSLAAAAGWCVDRYTDDASGTLARDAEGAMAMTTVVLRPAVVFGGPQAPDLAQLQALHERAHQRCFIARSVRSELRIEPRFERPPGA